MPKNKKLESSSDDSDSGPEDRTPAKKVKSDAPPSKTSDSKPKSSSSSKTDDGGDGKTWILEKLRMVKISDFRGRQMVDIREHYEANGEIRPGKKGICLSIPQWKKLCSIIDEVNKNLD